MKATLLSLFFGLCFVISANAQFTTASADGTIGATEYGANTGTGGQNCNSSLNGSGAGATRWYMTWDNANLYVGLENANVSEARRVVSRH